MNKNIDQIISRIREREGARTKRELAEILNISPQDFSQREKRGTLLPLLLEWAMQRNISLDWLISGMEREYETELLSDSENPVYRIHVKSTVSKNVSDPESPPASGASDYREEGMRLLSEILSSGNGAVIQLALTQLTAIADFLQKGE
ncbi:MAG: helix-turn-helix domain-containing protein [Desulfococcaceae bacterium]